MPIKVESSAHTVVTESRDTFNTGQVLTIAGAHLVHDVFSSFLAPLLPLIIDKLNFSLALAGSLSLYQRLPSVVNPFIGMLADRLDLRLFIILAPSVTAVAMSLLGLAPSYAMLALLLLIAGLSSASFHVPGPVMVTRVSGGQVGTGMSFWMTAGELARTIGPLFAVGIVSLLTLEGSWPVMTIGIAASVVIYIRIKDIAVRPPSQTHNSLGQTWRAMQHVLLPLTGILLARGFMRATLTSFLPTFMTAEGQSFEYGGMTLALLEFAGAVGALSAGTLSDRLGRRRVLLASMGTAPLFMLIFLVVKGWLIPPLLVLMGLSVFSTTPVVLAMVQDHAGDHPATANGLYMGISFVISSVIPMLVGGLADIVGLRTAFAWSALLALVGVPLIYLLPRDS
jgi:FSR family fosmidomycin resistance protein-like MFS transporter